MGSLIKVVTSTRLPLINRYVISSRAFVPTHQRCFFSTINDARHARAGLMNNLRRIRNVTVSTIYNFIYTDILNRFGLFSTRVFSYSSPRVKSSMSETDECLYYSLQMQGVISNENVNVNVSDNSLYIRGVAYDDFKAAYHVYTPTIDLPEDSYYLKYNMRGIKADFSEGGELELTIPKFNAAERILNEKKDEAGEFLKLKKDAFRFRIKVNAI